MEYDVIYSDRRTLALTIKNGRLLVRAPRRTTAEKIEQAIDSHRKWIEKHLEKQKHKVDLTASLTDDQIRELRRTARRVLTCKTEYFSKIMGLKYGRISITGAKTRFGSCNSKGNISYSYRLMLYPEDAIDYVVVHELAHLVQMNHSADFYRVVEKVLPDYKRRAKLLKE